MSYTNIIVIGGGSAGFAAASKAIALGKSVRMVNDADDIGGTCLNVGCIPSKAFIHAAKTLSKARLKKFHGIETTGALTDYAALVHQVQEQISTLRQQKYMDVADRMTDFWLEKGCAILTSPTTIDVNGATYSADHIVIATGSRTFVPDVPGLSDIPYLTNESIFKLEELPESLIILGGGYIALECAQLFSRLGSIVTIIQRSEQVLSDQDPDVSETITQYLREERVNIITNSHIQRAVGKGETVSFEILTDDIPQTVTASKVLVATGRTPNTKKMGLEDVGVELDHHGFVKVDSCLKTSVDSIFAAGDVTGPPLLVYTGAKEGEMAANNAIRCCHQEERDYSVLPRVIFTDPQVAGVGLDERQAKTSEIEYEISLLELKHIPKAMVAHVEKGMIKLIREKGSQKLLGARIIGPDAGDVIMTLAIAIKAGFTTDDLMTLHWPYLTYAEGIKMAIIGFEKDATQLSCCAT